jgi:hypothetical protein
VSSGKFSDAEQSLLDSVIVHILWMIHVGILVNNDDNEAMENGIDKSV